jgi:hypothetical protein
VLFVMSAKIKMAMGLAAATVAVAGGLAATGTAHASTDKCGQSCMTLVTQKFGVSFGLLGESGNAVALGPDADTPAADWAGEFQDQVNAMYAAHIVTKAVFDAWPNAYVFEFQWVPNASPQLGNNLCLGVTSAGASTVNVQTCGSSAKTLWIVLPSEVSGSYAPLISATTANTSHPGVLTATAATGALTITPLSENNAGVIAPNQMWQSVFGVLH